MDRRSFIRSAAGLFVAAAAAPIVEPVRRIWQVGAQLERAHAQRLINTWYREPVRLVGAVDVSLGDLPTGTLFGISAEPDLWSATKVEPLTWEKLQEGFREWERRASLPQEPPRYYLTPDEVRMWQAWARSELNNRSA